MEYLEERVVPDGAAGNLGVVTNSAVNFQSGITLIPNPPFADLSGITVGAIANLANGLNGLGGLPPGVLALGSPNNLPNFFQNVQGFGSGAQPNQPWVPNAYNLGLPNGQWAFPSQADFGFQSPPSGVRQFGLHFIRHEENNADADSDEQPAPLPTFQAVHKRAENNDSADQIAVDDEDAAALEEQDDLGSDLEARPISLVPHAATKTEAAVERAALSSNKADDPDATPHAAPTSWHEEDAFLGTLSARRVHDSDTLDARDEGSRAPSALLSEKDPFVMDNGEEVVPVLHRLNLSRTPALSVLTPAQFMALLVAFPAPGAPRDDGEEVKSLDESE